MLDAGSRPREPFTSALREMSGNGSLGALGTSAPLLSYYQSPCQASAPETSPSLHAKWKWLLFVHTHTPAHLPITQGWALDQAGLVAVPHPSCHCDQFRVETRIPLDLYESSQISESMGEASLLSLVKTESGCEARTASCHD